MQFVVVVVVVVLVVGGGGGGGVTQWVYCRVGSRQYNSPLGR